MSDEESNEIESISGEANITDDADCMCIPLDHAYLAAAEEALSGVKPLESVRPLPHLAMLVLCGQAAETALKAILVRHKGLSEDVLKNKPYRHSLRYCWGEATTDPAPDWLKRLDGTWSSFQSRYPTRTNGFVNDFGQTIAGIEELIEKAARLSKPNK